MLSNIFGQSLQSQRTPKYPIISHSNQFVTNSTTTIKCIEQHGTHSISLKTDQPLGFRTHWAFISCGDVFRKCVLGLAKEPPDMLKLPSILTKSTCNIDVKKNTPDAFKCVPGRFWTVFFERPNIKTRFFHGMSGHRHCPHTLWAPPRMRSSWTGRTGVYTLCKCSNWCVCWKCARITKSN